MARGLNPLSPDEARLAASWLGYLLVSTKMWVVADALNALWPGDTKLGQPDISKWLSDPGHIPRARLPHLSALVEHRICANVGCSPNQRPVYLFNLHPPYSDDRALEAEERLMGLLRVQLPPRIAGLAVVLYRTRLALGTGAQCLANRCTRPNVFFILIEAEREDTTPLSFADLTVGEQNLAFKEIRAHVFTNRYPPVPRTITE